MEGRKQSFVPDDMLLLNGPEGTQMNLIAGSPPVSPNSKARAQIDELEERKKKIPYTKLWIWRVGLFLVMVSSFVDFAALGFAPQTVIAPLGSVTLVANLILAPLMMGEKNTLYLFTNVPCLSFFVSFCV